jgi:hypothetical protein
MYDIIVVKQEGQHLWMMNPTRAIIPIAKNLAKEK